MDLASKIFPNGSFDATSFGPCCPQENSSIYIPKQDEQCLYLNIFRPIIQSNHSLLPVLVWIHGGGHKSGCSSQSIPLLYNGTNMIAHSPPDQPVVIVTINYRLGVLANMYLKELIEEDSNWPAAGNYMFLDMLSALRWIKTNIKEYGGDPNKVALFGESAGGRSVIELGAMKGSANLYRTAISQSGLGSPGTYSSYHNMSNALNYSYSVVQRLNCLSDDKERVLSCLRNASMEDLFKAYDSQPTKPVIDDYFFPMYPPAAIKNGIYTKNVSLIMGNNDYEIALCSAYPDMNLTTAVARLSQSFAAKWIPRIVDHFNMSHCSPDEAAGPNRCCDIVRSILMDNLFDCNVRRLYNALHSEYEGDRLFWYNLNCYPKCPGGAYKGVCVHTSEIPYVFGTTSDYFSTQTVNCTWDNESREFSSKVISHWISMATDGRPSSSWPNYDPYITKYFHITPDQGFAPVTWKKNCSIFDRIEAEGVNDAFGSNDSYRIKGTFAYGYCIVFLAILFMKGRNK